LKKLDRIDRRILDALQKNARISYVELGERVGLSTSPCLERVKRLESDGYIIGYTAILNPELMNAALMVYVEIKLEYDSRRIFVKIRVADMAEYRQLLGDILRDLPGVRDTRSYIVMEVIKETTCLSTD